MKKTLFLLLICLVSTSVTAQCDSTKTKEKPSGYLSAGLSTSNGNNFKAVSYVALEGGVMYKNVTLGAIFGRGNLIGMGRNTDVLGNYYYEFKTSGYLPIYGNLTCDVLFGWGGYFNSTHFLIEYGVGMVYNIGKIGYGVMYSNWDGVNYITPNITFNF
jgi:hypothetical protein